jgi:hypothetical protein
MKGFSGKGLQAELVHFWSTVNPQRPKSPARVAFGIVTGNALAATVYLTLAILGRGLSRGKPEPSLLGPASSLLVLFLIINAAWGVAMLARPRSRRWDLYVFVVIGWLVAIWIGSGLTSI